MSGNDGAFNTDTGVYYTIEGTKSKVLNIVDVTTLQATALNLSAIPWTNDLTYDDGFLWGAVGNNPNVPNLNPNIEGMMVRINLTSGQVDFFDEPAGMSNADVYGGAFTYGNGNLGLSNNAGGLFQVSITNPASASPTFTARIPAEQPSVWQSTTAPPASRRRPTFRS